MVAQTGHRQGRPDQQGHRHEAGQRRPSPRPLQPALPERSPPGTDRSVREVAIQIVRHRLGAGIATTGLLGQASQADRLQVARDLAFEARRRHRLLVDDLQDGLHRRRPLERRPAGEHLVKDRAERIDVGRRSDLLRVPSRLFGRDVAGRAEDLPGLGGAVLLQSLGQAEVRDLGRAIPREQDVRWLEVAMHDVGQVGGMDGPGQRRDQRRGRTPGLGNAAQRVIETAPLEQLERDERQAPDLVDVVNLDDVRMAHLRHGLRLDAEPRPIFGPGQAARPDHLQRDQAAQSPLAGLVDDPHAAVSQLRQDVVSVDLRESRPGGFSAGQGPRCAPRRAGLEDSRGCGTQRRNAGQPEVGRVAISIVVPWLPVQDQRVVVGQLPEPLLAGWAGLDVRDQRVELVPLQLLLEEPRERAVTRADNHGRAPASRPALGPPCAPRRPYRMASPGPTDPFDTSLMPRRYRGIRDSSVGRYERET